jgi:hypothetical protein
MLVNMVKIVLKDIPLLHAAGRIKITTSKDTHSSNHIPYDQTPLLKYGVLPYSEYDLYGPGTSPD